MKALAVIRSEHRSLAAVLHGLLHLVREIRYGLAAPDFVLFAAMVRYIVAFPERFHHPKEDQYLFRLLRLRDPASAALLDRLESEHREGRELIRRLEEALARYETEGAAAFGTFAATVGDYAAFHWTHMRLEETQVLPLAEQFLTHADWQEIDAAFCGHDDPLVGVAAGEEFDALYRRIVALAPAPLGTATAR